MDMFDDLSKQLTCLLENMSPPYIAPLIPGKVISHFLGATFALIYGFF